MSISRKVNAFHIATRKKTYSAQPISNPSNFCFSPDGRFLAIKSTSGRIVILDSSSGAKVTDFDNEHDGEGSNIEFSGCGAFVIDGSWNGIVRVRDQTNGRAVYEHNFPNTMITAVNSAQGGSLWLTAHQPKATTDDCPPGDAYFLRWAWPLPETKPEVLRFRVPFLRSSALSPDGKFLAVVFGAPPTTLKIFSLVNHMVIHTQQVVGGSAMRWSKCSRYLGFAQDRQISIIESGSFHKMYDYAIEHPSSVDFSPDGKLVALGSWSAGIIVALHESSHDNVK